MGPIPLLGNRSRGSTRTCRMHFPFPESHHRFSTFPDLSELPTCQPICPYPHVVPFPSFVPQQLLPGKTAAQLWCWLPGQVQLRNGGTCISFSPLSASSFLSPVSNSLLPSHLPTNLSLTCRAVFSYICHSHLSSQW